MRTTGRLASTGALALLCATSAAGAPQQGAGDAKKKKEEPLSLEPTRKVEFTTDEATWLSLDVSPDGGTIVFEILGDLYTLPVAGGQATRITEGMAYDSQPRWSPDGAWIAFISDRDGSDNLWIAKPDGSEPRQLSEVKGLQILSPAWMPDSRYVVVSRSSSGRDMSLFLYHVDGGAGVEATPSAGAAAPGPGQGPPPGIVRLGAEASPDGRFLYFARKNAASVYNQMSFEWQVYRRDLRTGDSDAVTQATGGAFRPLLSPDGTRLVYGTRHETETGLRIRNLDSGEDRWLAYPVQRDDMESRGTRDLLPSYAFLPDGSAVVTTRGGRIHRIDVETGASTEIPFQADVALDVGPRLNFPRRVGQGPVRARLIQDTVQSPDGGRLAFSAMTRLYVMDLPDGTPRALTGEDERGFKPAWSPDGAWIAWVSWDDQGRGHVWKARASGAEARRLTDVPAFYTDPVFSPDGSRIVARRGNAWMRTQTPSEFGGVRIPLDVVWLPAEGGPVRLIVPARGLGAPHFAADPDRIYFHSDEGLVSLRFDGTDRQTHVKIQARKLPREREPRPADDARISPDGRWVLAKVHNQLYRMAVPPLGGGLATVGLASPSVPIGRVTDVGADSFGWADGGETIAWSVGSTYFRRPASSVPFEKQKGGGNGDASASDTAAAEGEGADAADAPKPAREQHESVESFEVVLEFPRHTPRGLLVLRGAQVVTMADGAATPERADVLIEDDRIRAVGGDIEIPPDARVIDVSGTWVVPGFVDTHAHYEVRTGGVLEPRNWSLLANLAYGVTTGLDVQTSTDDYLAYLDLVEAGMAIGPRAYSTGPGVFNTNDFQSFEDTLHVLEKYKRYYRNDNLKSYMVGDRKQRQWVVRAAQQLEMTVTTEGGLDLKLDSTHAIDGFGGNEHALPIVPLFRDVVELFARTKTSYTPTLLVLYGGPWAENYFYTTTEVHDDAKLARFTPHNVLDEQTRRRPWFREDEHAFPKTAAQAAKIQRAGGLVGVGGHGQLQGLGYHWEMWSLAMGGMTPGEVLRAATLDGARIVGVAEDLGSLEPGKLADLVVLNRNPLEDIRNTNSIRYVVKNGEVFDGDTLDRIWPDEKAIEPFWWWDEQPDAAPAPAAAR